MTTSTTNITVTVNGTVRTVEVETRTLLAAALREQMGLTGTHVGCDTSQCGACVVHLNGRSVKSCSLLAVQADGAEIVTIEGLAKPGDAESGNPDEPDLTLHPMQQAFKEHHGLQCGFCTPGMVMSAIDLVQQCPDPSEAEIREWLEGNLCRCTGYQNIVKSIQAGAGKMRQAAAAR